MPGVPSSRLDGAGIAELARRIKAMRQRTLEEIPDANAVAAPARAVHDRAEEAEGERVDKLRMAETATDETLVRDIALAEHRIRTHDHGLCLDCGEAIQRERLLAHPTAVRCAACRSVESHQPARRLRRRCPMSCHHPRRPGSRRPESEARFWRHAGRVDEAHLLDLVPTGPVDGAIPADAIRSRASDFIAERAAYLHRGAESIKRDPTAAAEACGALSYEAGRQRRGRYPRPPRPHQRPCRRRTGLPHLRQLRRAASSCPSGPRPRSGGGCRAARGIAGASPVRRGGARYPSERVCRTQHRGGCIAAARLARWRDSWSGTTLLARAQVDGARATRWLTHPASPVAAGETPPGVHMSTSWSRCWATLRPPAIFAGAA